MSHPDPLYDPDNSYEDDDMGYHDDEVFYGEDSAGYHPDADHEMESNYDESIDYDDYNDDEYHDMMDGDFDSGMASAGHGTDEDYGYYGSEDDDYGYYGEDY
jgi:hypothetical protein